jgi:hypothetical protein
MKKEKVSLALNLLQTVLSSNQIKDVDEAIELLKYMLQLLEKGKNNED